MSLQVSQATVAPRHHACPRQSRPQPTPRGGCGLPWQVQGGVLGNSVVVNQRRTCGSWETHRAIQQAYVLTRFLLNVWRLTAPAGRLRTPGNTWPRLLLWEGSAASMAPRKRRLCSARKDARGVPVPATEPHSASESPKAHAMWTMTVRWEFCARVGQYSAELCASNLKKPNARMVSKSVDWYMEP